MTRPREAIGRRRFRLASALTLASLALYWPCAEPFCRYSRGRDPGFSEGFPPDFPRCVSGLSVPQRRDAVQ